MANSRNSTQDVTATDSQQDQASKPLDYLMTSLQAACLNHYHMPQGVRLASVDEGCDWLNSEFEQAYGEITFGQRIPTSR